MIASLPRPALGVANSRTSSSACKCHHLCRNHGGRSVVGLQAMGKGDWHGQCYQEVGKKTVPTSPLMSPYTHSSLLIPSLRQSHWAIKEFAQRQTLLCWS